MKSKKDLPDCTGCVDPRSEGTHSFGTKQHGLQEDYKKPEPTFHEWYGMEKSDGDEMSPVEYENNLPQKIRIDRVVEGYGRSWDGRYEVKVIYFDKGKLKEGIIPDDVVEYLVSKIQEYKR